MWINTKDKLPIPLRNVLIFFEGVIYIGYCYSVTDVSIGATNSNVFWDSNSLTSPVNNVEWWMPLPEDPITTKRNDIIDSIL